MLICNIVIGMNRTVTSMYWCLIALCLLFPHEGLPRQRPSLLTERQKILQNLDNVFSYGTSESVKDTTDSCVVPSTSLRESTRHGVTELCSMCTINLGIWGKGFTLWEDRLDVVEWEGGEECWGDVERDTGLEPFIVIFFGLIGYPGEGPSITRELTKKRKLDELVVASASAAANRHADIVIAGQNAALGAHLYLTLTSIQNIGVSDVHQKSFGKRNKKFDSSNPPLSFDLTLNNGQRGWISEAELKEDVSLLHSVRKFLARTRKKKNNAVSNARRTTDQIATSNAHTNANRTTEQIVASK